MRLTWMGLFLSLLLALGTAMGGEVTGELKETLECLNRYMDSLKGNMVSGG